MVIAINEDIPNCPECDRLWFLWATKGGSERYERYIAHSRTCPITIQRLRWFYQHSGQMPVMEDSNVGENLRTIAVTGSENSRKNNISSTDERIDDQCTGR